MSTARLMQMAAAGVSSASAPTLVGIENTVTTGSTVSLTLPAGILSGDIIVIFVGVDGTPTASITGFSQDIAAAGGWAISSSYYVFSKTSDGSEGSSVTLTLNASESVCASCWGITGADSIAFSSTANSSTVNPNSPSLTSGFGAVPTFWISSFATDNGSPTISAYPSAYGNGQSLSLSADHGSTRLGVSSKIDSVATEDPPAYTISSAHPAISVTVAVGNAPASSWTDPDLANASYDSVAIPASGTLTEANSYGITFKPDGTAFYYCGVSLDRIQMYTLSTPWDLSTATYTNNYIVGSNPRDISFSDDGTKMFVVHSSGDKIKRYDLSTAWDVTTSSLNSNTYNPTTNGQPRGLTLEQSGTKLFITDVGNLRSYSLSTAYDLSTASVVSTTTLVANNYGSAPQFNPSGTKLWVISSNQTLKQYSLSTAWDISTLSGDTPSLSFTSQDGTMPGMYIKPDGSKVYAVGLSTDKVYQYSTD